MIRFKDLSFAYQADTPILRQVNFEVQHGEKIAIVGPSGSGKSTLLKLILGYYPVEDGRVYLFGEDLNHWQLEAARQQMALVAQDTYLFPVSVEENIACGKLGSDRQAIEQAAAAANIHDYIQTLPQGYQTSVGERGARLSGGQKQRLSLARAILKNAPVLLLDEPTSALDSESEALVQEALDRFMADHTTIVIAHRLSTIKNADRVLVLDQGQIIEQGSHEELLAKGGLYQELYHKQFGLVTAPGGRRCRMKQKSLASSTLWRLFQFLSPKLFQYFASMLIVALSLPPSACSPVSSSNGSPIPSPNKDMGLLKKTVLYWVIVCPRHDPDHPGIPLSLAHQHRARHGQPAPGHFQPPAAPAIGLLRKPPLRRGHVDLDQRCGRGGTGLPG